MNNEWLNNLRSRMENHEEEVPEGLWDDIRDKLFSEEEENKLITGFIPAIDAENKEQKVGKQMLEVNSGRIVLGYCCCSCFNLYDNENST